MYSREQKFGDQTYRNIVFFFLRSLGILAEIKSVSLCARV